MVPILDFVLLGGSSTISPKVESMSFQKKLTRKVPRKMVPDVCSFRAEFVLAIGTGPTSISTRKPRTEYLQIEQRSLPLLIPLKFVFVTQY